MPEPCKRNGNPRPKHKPQRHIPRQIESVSVDKEDDILVVPKRRYMGRKKIPILRIDDPKGRAVLLMGTYLEVII